jgi:predicted nucleic acid-binding protein
MYRFRSEAFHHQDTKTQRILGDLVSWWWIQKRRFSSLTGIDPGEAEAVALAVGINADWLVMDEGLDRETARHFGLRCVGLIGVPSAAKRRGAVSALHPLLDQLRDVAGFRISSALYEQVLRDAGELDQ